jgi:hypothetical protein
MDNVVAFVCQRLRHVKWSAGPEPDLARVADRGEGDPPRCLAAGEVALIHFIPLHTAQPAGRTK